ncbi:MAG: endolytic transglycosylase MltG [Burkholderiales bacterium]|nr:endolytic transglycosylase MltG [Burkholderiales bacterium]
MARAMSIIFLLLVLAAVSGVAYVWRYMNTPYPLDKAPADFTLEHGTTMKMAAKQLADQGLITEPWLLTWLARVHGDASRIKAGSYELTQPVTPMQLLAKLSDGDVTSATLLIVEGWNWRQVRAAMAKNPDLKHDTANLDDQAVDTALGIDAPSPEGMFFPDTYHFAKQSSELQVLKRAHEALEKQLSAAWDQRSDHLSIKTPYEALTLASIVEKETGKADDRAMVSAVFNNRLRLGMRLQTDPSVIYGLGERYDGTIHKTDLETDTPYNTYTRAGLTPTPIAMPGAKSLLAAVSPAHSNALYFVARGDGSSAFSDTLAEHNQKVRRYQLGGQ